MCLPKDWRGQNPNDRAARADIRYLYSANNGTEHRASVTDQGYLVVVTKGYSEETIN